MVWPAAIVLGPDNSQAALVSTIWFAKWIYFVPSPLNMPGTAAERSSRVLIKAELLPLPPSTRPSKMAPGSMINRLLNPLPRRTA